MTRCTTHRLDDPTGLCCTRETHGDHGHIYENSAGSHLRSAHGQEQDDE